MTVAAGEAGGPRIALLAGELSGDQLGADLMRALKRRLPDVRFEGIGGPAMAAEGLSSLVPLETLSVMGLVEVLRHLPRLLRLRRELARRFIADPPDLFVGIDAPDFNLGLERRLRAAGITTAHYVSPSVWAWRQNRIKGIRESVDLMLTLFPFEAQFYEEHGVSVSFVGHPAADRLAPDTPSSHWRTGLGIPAQARCLALLPGSRRSEVERLGPLFAKTAQRLLAQRPELELVAPMATGRVRASFEQALDAAGIRDRVKLLDGQAERAMGAADVVLVASGTAALEAMLLGRAMVVAYRLAPLTHLILRLTGLVKIKQYSLPNLLARSPVVPEYIQAEATPAALAPALGRLLDEPAARARQTEVFHRLHGELHRSAGDRAAEALIACLQRKNHS